MQYVRDWWHVIPFSMKALVIEDHEDIVTFIRKGLQYEQFIVDTAMDGEIAVEKALNNTYDIFIVDLLLPKKDGSEFLQEIRSRGDNTPALILTAIQDPETKVKLLNIGADDYLEKPFSFNELIARIQAILRRVRGVPKRSVLQVSDLILNPLTREVSRGETSIVLRNKEFSLLEYLMEHVGEVVHRTALLEKVWDFNANVFSNTIETHIASLRQKIDGGYKKKLLKTIHGVGYKITDIT